MGVGKDQSFAEPMERNIYGPVRMGWKEWKGMIRDSESFSFLSYLLPFTEFLLSIYDAGWT